MIFFLLKAVLKWKHTTTGLQVFDGQQEGLMISEHLWLREDQENNNVLGDHFPQDDRNIVIHIYVYVQVLKRHLM